MLYGPGAVYVQGVRAIAEDVEGRKGAAGTRMAASILNADFAELHSEIACIEGVADVLHLDVMDGNFVPNLTFGPLVARAIRGITDMPLDVHLMVMNPERYIGEFAEAGADWISIHVEAASQGEKALRDIRERGLKAGLALNPATGTREMRRFLSLIDFAVVMTVVPGFGGQSLIREALGKVRQLKDMAGGDGGELEVEVDGGVKASNLPEVMREGADIVVVGSSIFTARDRRAAALEIRGIMDNKEGMLL